MVKLKDLLQSKIDNMKISEKVKKEIINLDNSLVNWYNLVDKFVMFSHRLPEKVSTKFKSDKLIQIWNQILDKHKQVLDNITNRILLYIDEQTNINESEKERLKQVFITLDDAAKFYLDNQKITFETDNTDTNNDNENTQKKKIFIISLHPRLKEHINNLLFDLLTSIDDKDLEQIKHKYMKTIQLTLISYTIMHCNYCKEIWEQYQIPEFIDKLYIVVRFTELKKKLDIGLNTIYTVYKHIYEETDNNNGNSNNRFQIEKLPEYVLIQTLMIPGARINNVEDIYCKTITDYIEKIRKKKLNDLYRSETQTYTYSQLLTYLQTKENIPTYQYIESYLKRLKEILYKYRFSEYKLNKPYEQIDKEFYLELFNLYKQTIYNEEPVLNNTIETKLTDLLETTNTKNNKKKMNKNNISKFNRFFKRINK